MKINISKLTDTQKKGLIEKAYKLAYEYEQKYGNCAQCTIAAIQDVFGIVDDSVFKAAHGLAGGVGLSSKGHCGALSGGIMIIGSIHGRERSEFASGRNPKSYGLSKEFMERFKEKYGSILCHEIQKSIMGKSFDLSDPDEYKEFEKAGGHNDKCPEVVGNAAKLIADMLVNGEI